MSLTADHSHDGTHAVIPEQALPRLLPGAQHHHRADIPRQKGRGSRRRARRVLIVHPREQLYFAVQAEVQTSTGTWREPSVLVWGMPVLRFAFQLCSMLGLLCFAGLLWARWLGVAGMFFTGAIFTILNGVAWRVGEDPVIGPRAAPMLAFGAICIGFAMVVVGITA